MKKKMKLSYKAALLSAFVFPGVGHLYVKRYSRGLVIMFIVIAGLGYMIWSTTVYALNLLDKAVARGVDGTINLQELSNIAGSKMSNTDSYSDVIFYIIICLWIFAIIDAYRIGKQKEVQDKKITPL